MESWAKKILMGTLPLVLLLTCSVFANEDWIDARYEGIEGKPYSALRLLRNEIFARHGRLFESDELKSHFMKQAWYKPDPQFKESMLSDRERSLVSEISFVEAGPDDQPEETREFLNAYRNARSLAGIPESLGNVKLGAPPPTAASGGFLDLPGAVCAVVPHSGKVYSVGYALQTHHEMRGPQIARILTKLVGFEPKMERGSFAWRNRTRVLRLVRQGADFGASYSLILHEATAGEPGNPGDGFPEFVRALHESLAAGVAEKAVEFFAIPLKDGSDSLAFKTKSEFLANFADIRKELSPSDPSITGGFDGSGYAFRFGTRLVYAERVGKTWKVTGLAYEG